MESTVISIKENLEPVDMVETAFSFKPFITYLKRRAEVEKTIKSEFYRFVLNKFRFYPHLETDSLEIEDVAKYTDILELVYTILAPEIEDESKFFWAMSTPLPSRIIYSTDAFFSFISDHNATDEKQQEDRKLTVFHDQQEDFIYRLILQKLYNFPSDISNDIIYTQPDPKTNINKYFRIHTDTSFIEVTAKDKLPEINAEMIEPFLYDGVKMNTLQEVIPLHLFRLEGFSVVTIEDVTAERSVDNIRAALVNRASEQTDLYREVLLSLQTLGGNGSIRFGLLPFIRVNGTLVFDVEECSNSKLIKAAKQFEIELETLGLFVNNFIDSPRSLFFSTISDKKIAEFPFLSAVKESGIKSYALLPVFYNRKIAGLLEVYSEQKLVFYEKLLSRLQSALPLVAQMLQNSAEQFSQRLEEVIKANFTTLQKPVEWKFNEAAWHYLIKQNSSAEKSEMEIVSFDNVYPLFGSIDIRDSTIKHNAALHQDMDIITDVLSSTVKALQKHLPKGKATKLSVAFKAWLKEFNAFRTSNDETLFSNLLHDIVHPYLLRIKKDYPATEPLLVNFSESVNEKKGEGYANRRALESSIHQINSSLNHYFENAQPRLQKIYPCYFEKFRSDGVEYDIYAGQTIAPGITFTPLHLRLFRQWQLQSMIDVAQLGLKLQSKMEIPLQIASLIFVHSSQINICFRNDERRFDVEGYYNIRYEVIKKRIDKACIKNTGLRLTQPGKISIVYFNDAEAEDYIAHIKELQKDKKLKKDLRFVKLEELQGVTGLKALQVSINFR